MGTDEDLRLAAVRTSELLDEWWEHERAVPGYAACRGGCRRERGATYPCPTRIRIERELEKLGVNPHRKKLDGWFSPQARAQRGKGPW